MKASLQTEIWNELETARQLLQSFMQDERNLQDIEKAAVLMADAIRAGGKIITCGNGGSHCDAMHFAEELTGRYRLSRRPLPALAVADPSHISCVGNDFGFGKIFSRYIEALGRPRDVLLAISSSGSSLNIRHAVTMARERNMQVVLLLGKDGGLLRDHGDVSIIVPHMEFADRIQEIHIKVIHTIIYCLEKLL